MTRMASTAGLMILASVVGCGAPDFTATERSGVERLTLSAATDRAVLRLETSTLAGRRVYVRGIGFSSEDEIYALAAIRDHLGRGAVLMAETPERAEAIVEARCGVLNTDQSSSLLGIPAIPLPIPGGGVVHTPEVALYKHTRQVATAKIALNVSDADTGRQIFSTGPQFGQAAFNRWRILLIFSFHTSDVPEGQVTSY